MRLYTVPTSGSRLLGYRRRAPPLGRAGALRCGAGRLFCAPRCRACASRFSCCDVLGRWVGVAVGRCAGAAFGRWLGAAPPVLGDGFQSFPCRWSKLPLLFCRYTFPDLSA